MSLVVEGEQGTITVPDSVLLQIASRAAESLGGVRVRRRRTIDVQARTAHLELTARRGEPLVSLGERAQEAMASALEAMCDLELTVDVTIEVLV